MAIIYRGYNFTSYCGCSYLGKFVNHKSCGYIPYRKKSKRAYRVEWEHIVPASAFGRFFPSWIKGHKRCLSSKNKSFNGRRCTRKVSNKFRLMEADLYNLMPVIGEINYFRNNLEVCSLESTLYSFGDCKIKIGSYHFEPRNEIKGLIARTYFYMHETYKNFNIVNEENFHQLVKWNKSFPPTEFELKRSKRIERQQGNSNSFVFFLEK
ncbi:MAG: endonuclease I [Zetaproteobacteria bacterium]|nr:endonuclease I [Pseudobdellovibrionaceae bacterium]